MSACEEVAAFFAPLFLTGLQGKGVSPPLSTIQEG